MAKHRKQSVHGRRVVAASAVVASASVLTPGVANAADVVIPGTDIKFAVDGIENVPAVANHPAAGQFIPSLNEAAAPYNGAAASEGEAPAEAPAEAAAPAAAPTSTGQQIADAALSKMGSPYGWGSAGPNAFDCSGLTSWAYAQVGKQIPRTSQAQASSGTPVSIDALQPGDIVAYYSGASHVGIYVGDGQIVDSLNEGTTVTTRPLDYMPIHSAVRF